MLNASGPQAGQHGDSRARVWFDGVDSVLRADPQAPRGALGNDGAGRACGQGGDQRTGAAGDQSAAPWA